MAKQKVKAGLRRSALFFREEQLKALATLSELTGASTAWMIRKAVDEYLERRKGDLEPEAKKR